MKSLLDKFCCENSFGEVTTYIAETFGADTVKLKDMT